MKIQGIHFYIIDIYVSGNEGFKSFLKLRVKFRVYKRLIDNPTSGFLIFYNADGYKFDYFFKISENESIEVTVKAAHKKMKILLEEINQHKKQFDIYSEIDSWQKNVEKWNGPNILDNSSQLVIFSEGTELKKGPLEIKISSD